MEIIFNRKLSRLFLSTSGGWGTHYFYWSWVARQRGGKWRGMSSLPQVLTSKMSLFWLWEPESEEMTVSFSGAPSMFLPPLRQQRSEVGVLGSRAQHYRLWSVRPCYLISARFCFLPPWRYCKGWTTRVGAGTVPGPREAHDQEGQQLLGLRHMVAGHGTQGTFGLPTTEPWPPQDTVLQEHMESARAWSPGFPCGDKSRDPSESVSSLVELG